MLPGNTRESRRRGAATRAAPKCVAEAEAAVARAQAEGNAALVAVASAYSRAAIDLRDAHPEKKGDAHILFRAAEASYRVSVASSKAVGGGAVAAVQKLVEASNAFGVAAKAVVDAVDFDTKLARRQDLAAAEDAFENLYKYKPTMPAPTMPAPTMPAAWKPRAKKTAHRQCPNTCTDRSSNSASSRRRRAGRGCGVASARAASPTSAASASSAST